MPRLRHLGSDSSAGILCYIGALAAALAICGLVFLHIAFTSVAKAETVNRDAKQSYQAGKSYHRVCALTEADNIEIVNRLSPNAEIIRYKRGQARLYTVLLKTGQTTGGRNVRLHGGYDVDFPVPDRLYIIIRAGRSTVFPFFIVDGCVAQIVFQFPRALHYAIVKQMKTNAA